MGWRPCSPRRTAVSPATSVWLQVHPHGSATPRSRCGSRPSTQPSTASPAPIPTISRRWRTSTSKSVGSRSPRWDSSRASPATTARPGSSSPRCPAPPWSSPAPATPRSPLPAYADLSVPAERLVVDGATHWGLVLNRRLLATLVPTVVTWLERAGDGQRRSEGLGTRRLARCHAQPSASSTTRSRALAR